MGSYTIMKKSIRKNILAGVGILFWGISSSSAMESQVKIGAVIDVQGIHYKTSGDATQRKFSVHNKNRGLYSSGNFLVDYQLVAESGWKCYLARHTSVLHARGWRKDSLQSGAPGAPHDRLLHSQESRWVDFRDEWQSPGRSLFLSQTFLQLCEIQL